MGEVCRATDTRLGRTVAIKVLRSDVAAGAQRRRRFEQEARAAYEDFLVLWKDADPDLPVLRDARREYARLK